MPDGGTSLIELILLVAIAAFLVMRLRSVLGRRHGEEESQASTYRRAEAPHTQDNRDNVVTMPGARNDEVDAPPHPPADDGTVAGGLARIAHADPSFDTQHFMSGARQAFPMIVDAFDRGDRETLGMLLSDDIYAAFNAEMDRRDAAQLVAETHLDRVDEPEITEARMDGGTALITVRYTSQQRGVVRDASGQIVEGDLDDSERVVDLWTFARNTNSNDPNWRLIATATPE